MRFSLLIYILVLYPLFGQSLCENTRIEIDQYISHLEDVKEEWPNRDFYNHERNQYSQILDKLFNSDCNKMDKDSLQIEIMEYFAEDILKPQGVLETYHTFLNDCSSLMSKYVKMVEKKLTMAGQSLDYLRNTWYSRLENLNSRLEEVDLEYASFKIYINREHPFKEMTRIFVKNRMEKTPVKIHFKAPEDVEMEEYKKRRLDYISNNFDFVLSSYNKYRGFYFELPYLPLSTIGYPKPDQTYAVTFNEQNRFRIHNFSALMQDSLVLPMFDNWEYVEAVSPQYIKLDFPANLRVSVYDEELMSIIQQSSILKIEKEDGTNTVYIPANQEINQKSLIIKQRNRVFTWVGRVILITLTGSLLFFTIGAI